MHIRVTGRTVSVKCCLEFSLADYREFLVHSQIQCWAELNFLLSINCGFPICTVSYRGISLPRDGKEPSLLEFGSVRVLPNIRVRSVRVLSSYGKMKVRFWFGSSCRVLGSVRFGSMRVLIHIYQLVYMITIYAEYTAWVKKIHQMFQFFPKSWELFVQILLTYYYFIYARLQIFIQLGLSPTVMKSCHIKCDHPACV